MCHMFVCMCVKVFVEHIMYNDYVFFVYIHYIMIMDSNENGWACAIKPNFCLLYLTSINKLLSLTS